MKTLGELCTALYDAKKAEEETTKARIEIEDQISALVETDSNGSKTVDAGNGLKVTVKRSMAYKANVCAIRDIGDMNLPGGIALPLKFVPPQPAGYEFDEKAYENMRTTCPMAFSMIAKHVEVKPRKVAVSLKI